VLAAVISDLHLGSRTRGDLLSRPEIRERLFEALADADEIVLLGDSVELRDDPLGQSLERALPFFEALGEAFGGRRVTIVPGNHDHRLTAGWLGHRGSLGLERRTAIGPGDPLEPVVRRMGSARVELAYPGMWLRPDVYATHGHYLDCHSDARTFECRGRAVTERLLRVPRGGYRAPGDYEAALAPMYRLIHWSVQAPGIRGAAHAAKALVRRWEQPRADRSARVRPGMAAMSRVVRNLGVDARHVLFGHLHRPGRWDTEGGVELVNTGGWVEDASSVSPGSWVLVRDDGPPELEIRSVSG
jgi:UDP-2,3-diacylglucosamine pyrophosphatase LpxH